MGGKPLLDEVYDGDIFSTLCYIHFPVMILVSHRVSLFVTSLSTVLHLKTLLRFNIISVLIVLLKIKELEREEYIIGLLEVNVMKGCPM